MRPFVSLEGAAFLRPHKRTAMAIGLALAIAGGLTPSPGRTQVEAPLRADQIASIRAALAAAPEQGLPPQAPPASAAASGWLEAAASYVGAQKGGRIPLQQFPKDWGLRPGAVDARQEAQAALAGNRLADWLQQAPPPYEGYRRLQVALAQYRGFQAQGGWAALPADLRLKPGDRSPVVADLRRRLLAEGYLVGETAEADLFDPRLAQAVAIFQRLHGLPDDSAVGKATVAELNVAVTARIATLEANLERWRWMPRPLPARRVEVNTAAAMLEAYDGGEVRLSMRVIVGKPATPSPMFADVIEAVVFNPPWNVPASIAAREILPKARKDPGYMARMGYVHVGARVQQRPGPRNALGLIKFDLPNGYDVYLHDTPARGLFDSDVRALSHGCIRLQAPKDLVLFAMGDGFTTDEMEAAIAAGRTQRVHLIRPLPVYLVYRTAFVDADGQVQFRKDLYRWDEKLLAELGKGAAA